MAGVPDTATFSLQDVVNVIPLAQSSLQDCFDDAVDDFFDPTYKGSKDALLNFRNYGGSVGMYFQYVIANDGFIDHNDFGWSTVRSAASGSTLYTASQYEVYVDDVGSGDYEIARTFLSFDLSAIPVLAVCESAILGFRVITEYGGVDDPIAVVGSQGSTIEVGDYDAYTNANVMLGVYEAANQTIFNDLDFTDQLRASGSTQLGYVESAFGGTLDLAMINYYHDQVNQTPSAQAGIQIFRAGEVYVAPLLYVVFTI